MKYNENSNNPTVKNNAILKTQNKSDYVYSWYYQHLHSQMIFWILAYTPYLILRFLLIRKNRRGENTNKPFNGYIFKHNT